MKKQDIYIRTYMEWNGMEWNNHLLEHHLHSSAQSVVPGAGLLCVLERPCWDVCASLHCKMSLFVCFMLIFRKRCSNVKKMIKLMGGSDQTHPNSFIHIIGTSLVNKQEQDEGMQHPHSLEPRCFHSLVRIFCQTFQDK